MGKIVKCLSLCGIFLLFPGCPDNSNSGICASDPVGCADMALSFSLDPTCTDYRELSVDFVASGTTFGSQGGMHADIDVLVTGLPPEADSSIEVVVDYQYWFDCSSPGVCFEEGVGSPYLSLSDPSAPAMRGCKRLGCDPGYECSESVGCGPSVCLSPEANGTWNCGNDCSGGVCIPVPESCEGVCGEESPNGTCSCSEVCEEEGNCCADFCTVCSQSECEGPGDPGVPALSTPPLGCSDRECGNDGSGNLCGGCSGTQVCSLEGACVEGCPNEDGCGPYCSPCSKGLTCVSDVCRYEEFYLYCADNPWGNYEAGGDESYYCNQASYVRELTVQSDEWEFDPISNIHALRNIRVFGDLTNMQVRVRDQCGNIGYNSQYEGSPFY